MVECGLLRRAIASGLALWGPVSHFRPTELLLAKVFAFSEATMSCHQLFGAETLRGATGCSISVLQADYIFT
jgi:hypothetical protein